MEKKKFDFKKFSLVLCVCFITLFAFIPFANFNKIGSVSALSSEDITYDNGISATADNVDVTYLFTGSNFMSSAAINESGTDFTKRIYMASFQFGFTINSSLSYISTNSYCYLPEIYNSDSLGFINSGVRADSWEIKMDNTYYRSNILFYYRSSSNFAYLPIWLKVNNSAFTGNIYKVVFGSSSSLPLSDLSINSVFRYNYVQYYDINDNFLTIVIDAYEINNNYGNDSYYEKLLFLHRTYYLNDPSNFTDNESYNFGYNTGYSDGYISGESEGNSSGYKDGYNVGVTEGYNNGYNVGISDSNQYSFYNLFGAVLDAPVRVFSDLFNFNLLGVNLLGLITGLITLAFVILIIKLCIGGK